MPWFSVKAVRNDQLKDMKNDPSRQAIRNTDGLQRRLKSPVDCLLQTICNAENGISDTITRTQTSINTKLRKAVFLVRMAFFPKDLSLSMGVYRGHAHLREFLVVVTTPV